MKAETRAKMKAKATRVVNTVKEWAIPLMFVTTISAAWTGYVQSSKNEREIRRISHNQNVVKDVVNHNAKCLLNTMTRVDDLESKNKELLNEAMDVTEGKEEPAT